MEFEDYIKMCVVKILDSKNNLLGTGFWVLPDGYCLTCFHIVTDRGKLLSSLGIEYNGNMLQVSYDSKLSNPSKDVAVLRVTDANFQTVPSVVLGPAQMDTTVRSYGYRRGFGGGYSITWTLRPGQILAKVGYVYNLQTTFPDGSSIRGMSGAPVFDPKRKVVIGILYGEEEEGPAVSYVHSIDKVYESWPELASRSKIGLAQVSVEQNSGKNFALLDQRLATEMVIFFSQQDRSIAVDARTPYLLQFALGLFEHLLVENVYGSTLETIINRERAILGQAITFIVPSDDQVDEHFKTMVEENGSVLATDLQFQVVASQYEKLKGSLTRKISENIVYLQHTLRLAKLLNAIIIPHPDRWLLYRWWFEHCIWSTESPLSNVTVTPLPEEVTDASLKISEASTERVTKFSARLSEYTKMPLAMYRYGPMPYPFLPGLLYHYDRKDLASFEPFLYEFCAPAPVV